MYSPLLLGVVFYEICWVSRYRCIPLLTMTAEVFSVRSFGFWNSHPDFIS